MSATLCEQQSTGIYDAASQKNSSETVALKHVQRQVGGKGSDIKHHIRVQPLTLRIPLFIPHTLITS
jgi:hypothetical protein